MPAPSQEVLDAKPDVNRFWEFGGRPQGSGEFRRSITHNMLIDFLLANPRATRQEIAANFNYKSVANISIIINSDAFQAAFAKRRSEMVDPVVAASVEERIRGLASDSAEKLAEKLASGTLTTRETIDVFREATRAGNYGSKAPAQQNSFVVHLPGPASSSREWSERFAPPEAEVVQPRLLDAPSEKGPAE